MDNENVEKNIVDEIIPEVPEWTQKGYSSLEYMQWFEQENDYYLLRNYDLNPNSLVVDIGCYNATWIKDMYCKYNCNCIGIEPVKKYYEEGNRLFTYSDKVKLYNYGLTVDKKQKSCMMCLKGDESKIDDNGEVYVELVYAKHFFDSIDKDIDVLQINIEGYEYILLPFMFNNGLLNKVKNIQIQFHTVGSYSLMNDMISALEYWGFQTKFNYPFIWYGGSK